MNGTTAQEITENQPMLVVRQTRNLKGSHTSLHENFDTLSSIPFSFILNIKSNSDTW